MKQTLCWDCINAVPTDKCGCSWSREFEPVKGWTAEEVKMNYSGSDKKKYVTAYLVLKCPEFERG